MDERWPVFTIRVPASATPGQWEIFCAMAGEHDLAGYIEFGEQPTGAPLSADFAFPEAGAEANSVLERIGGALGALAADFLPAEGLEITGRLVADEKWTERWREFYHPTLVTPHIVVGPPDGALPNEAAPDAMYLRIELGSAFGTGGHASTRGSLVLIEEVMRDETSHHVRTFLDMGTGTGVLSFAALRMGAQKSVGMDADHHAEPNFEWNARLNDCEGRARFVLGKTVEEALEKVREQHLAPPDLIACNMISRDFDPLLEPLRKLVGKPMVLSGFLREEDEAVRARLHETGWVPVREIWIEDWGTWLCQPQ